ncbi:MAG: hypothetical protein WCG85_24615 [Polyangia bacterium]
MARNSSRRLPLLRWQYLRWALLLPALPLALWACNGHKLQTPTPVPQQETDFAVLVAPDRNIDILFMVDNSPSMDPKQHALATNFPKMINALEQLPGGLPDVHIGVVSSNMGAGNGAMGGNCGTGLGDQGLLWGNDPNNMIASVAAGSAYTPSFPGCGLNPGARWIEDTQDPNNPGRIQNYDSANHQLADVFSCLAQAVGVQGCGEEHQLQATRVALIPQPGINDANAGFLRSDAYLAIVLITDEDDCSASNNNQDNDDMFDMVTKRDVGDTTSLRCAARGHLCGGNPIPNFDTTNGYQGTAPFSHPFSDCSAKTQLDRSHPDYVYLPLIDVQDVIDNINALKAQPQDKILVSGIIGWPPDPNVDTNLPASLVQYDTWRIDKDPTSQPPSQQSLWDYMPICQDPNQKSADGNIYKAYGGLRLDKFVKSFGTKGQVFSICNSDFTNAMVQIGNAIVQVLTPGCVYYPLIDTDPNTPGVQPECQVNDQVPCDTPGKNGCLDSGYQETPMHECKDSNGNLIDPATPDPNSVPDTDSARPCWYLSYDNTALGCQKAFNGQRISALRRTGTVAKPGTNLAMKCLTCPNADTCNK